MSIFLFNFQINIAQTFEYPDPYSEKLLLNPAYSGLTKCKEINLNYKINCYEHLYSVSYNQKLNNYNSGLAFIALNNSQSKGSINNFSLSGIYSYKIIETHQSLLNIALQASFYQQNINKNGLIFSDQIDPFSAIINPVSSEVDFQTYNSADFSSAIAYISNKFRSGISVFHIDKLFRKDINTLLKPGIKINFGKIFSVNKFENSSDIYLIPEIIYNNVNGFHQFVYAFHVINNNFLTRLYLKHTLNLNTSGLAVSIGYNYKSIRLSYVYEININKYISLPISQNQISLQYKIDCNEKRKYKNTIYCSNF